MNQKLGWLRSFRKDLARWSECHAVMKHCLKHLERNAVKQLKQWTKDNLGKIMTAKRQLAFQEFAASIAGSTNYGLK